MVDSVSIGDYGYSTSLEYRLGIVRAGVFAFEAFVFYDVASAANDIMQLAENTRHTIGPGVRFHFFDPVNLTAELAIGISGTLLGNKDGSNISYSIAVVNRK